MPNKRKLKEINFHRNYKNDAEKLFAEVARDNGWSVTKCGYPDFICYKDNDLMLVEVKKKRGRLKTGQHKLMNALSLRGIKCYKWTPETDFFNK